jgi:hypothetical protein
MSRRFLLTSDLVAQGLDDRWLRRAEAAGDLVRVRRGVYLGADEHEDLDGRWRHIASISALMCRIRRPVVVSHLSAAALWGFPVLDRWPSEVHVTDSTRATGKRTSTVVRHPGQSESGALRHGIVCTSAVRTAVDVGLAHGFLPALLAFDHGLRTRLFTAGDVQNEIDE